ncbi:uncharacterized protein LOC135400338 isoform X2 [Ornithodoros turicata]|uniref:uncharacterized protein LOC135400338 isoform X2 n=1 Tax=Ornithodoros turicata TaxID=34597 RepID=UPI003138859D
MYCRVALWGILMLHLFQETTITVAAIGEQQLNIEALISDFVGAAADRRRVLWWDITAQQPVLKNNPHFRNRKVTISTGPIIYGNETSVSVRAPHVYEHWVHNDRYNESHTSVVKKTITQSHSYTWNLVDSYSLRHAVKVTAGLPDAISVESTTTTSFNLTRGSQDTKTDISQVEVTETVTVKPRTSTKLTWTVSNIAKDIPWSMNVTLNGWIAVWYYKKVSGHYLWFYPIDFLSAEGLHRIQGGGIQFTANGTFTGVNSEMSSLRVEEHDLRTYTSKPLSVTYRPVNVTRITVVGNKQYKKYR